MLLIIDCCELYELLPDSTKATITLLNSAYWASTLLLGVLLYLASKQASIDTHTVLL